MLTRCYLLFAACCLPLWCFPLAAQPQPAAKQSAPRLDHYGDPLPEHALLRIGTTRFRPGGVVTALAFTDKDSRLVTVNPTTGAHVWDVATGKELLAFGRPASENAAITVSPDGTLAAIVEADNKCHIYKTTTGQEVAAISTPARDTTTVRLSHDNLNLGTITTGIVDGIWITKIATGELVRRLEHRIGPYEQGLAFSADGSKLAYGSRHFERFGLCGLPDGKLFHKIGSASMPDPSLIGGHGIRGLSAKSYDLLAFSPDGKMLTAHDGGSGSFVFWETATGKPLHKLPLDNDFIFCCLAFAPDSKLLAIGTNAGEVVLWDTATGKRQQVLSGHKGWVTAVAFSADGKRLAACDEATIRVWDVATAKQVHAFAGHAAPDVHARFTTDGKTLVSTSHSNRYFSTEWFTPHFWDSYTGKGRQQTALDPKGVVSYCLSADGRMFALADKSKKLQLRNLETEKEMPALEQNKESEYQPLQFTADGRYLAAKEHVANDPEDSERESIHVWDTATGKIVYSLKGRVNDRFECRFTDDGRQLVALSWPYGDDHNNKQRFTITFWDFRTGRKVMRPKVPLDALVRSAHRLPQLSPSGRLLDQTINNAGHLRLCELATGKACFGLQVKDDAINCVAISPDGRLIAAGTYQGNIYLGDFSSDKPLGKLSGHRRRVSSVGFSPDGKRLVSGGDDTTILVWDMSPWTNRAAKPLPAEVAVKLWTDLGHENAAKGYAAIGQFLQSPKETVALLSQKLRPIAPAETKEIAKCIADLNSERFAEREQAMVKLEKHGMNAFVALDKCLAANPTLEMRRRVELIVSKLENQPLSGEALQALRALELLEMLCTPEAAALLESLSRGEPDAWLTQEAAASLERVRKRAVP